MSNPGYPSQQYGDPRNGVGGIANPGYPPQGGFMQPASTAYPPQGQAGYPPQGAYPPPPSYEAATKPAQVPFVQVVDPPPSSTMPPSTSYYMDDDVGPISFDDKSIRRGFIRRVYFILMCQLGFTVATICLFVFCKPVNYFVTRGEHSLAIYFSAYGIFFVLYFVLVCCQSVRRNYPGNLICLTLFTVSLSYLVGVISSFHETNVVLIVMGVTTLVCMSVMIFSCQTKYDFTTWGGVLFCAALALFFLAIFTPLWYLVLHTTAGMIILGGAIALLFVAFLAYDTQLIMGGRKYELSPEEYVFGALALYLDIIRIFLLLLALFGRGNN